MILTFKIRHTRNFSSELVKARVVANFAVKYHSRSSKDVKRIGLKSAIASQILKKYSSNKKLKGIGSVKLTVPAQGIKVDHDNKMIRILCLKLMVSYPVEFLKVNQAEVDNEYV